MTKKNIYLIGPMGAGKSSVGKRLAEIAEMPFYDSDEEIEKGTGVTISWIFQIEGEPGFREREAEMITKLTQLDGIILSTGGGCIVTPINRTVLKENGVVVYLKVSLNKQVNRTSRHRNNRPLLEVDNPKDVLEVLNAEREPLYEEIADLTYSTDCDSPQALAGTIWDDVQALKKS